MNYFQPLFKSLFFVTTLFAVVLTSTASLAASQCKGLENKACIADGKCSWVKGYQRSDGKKVNAFCRAKAGKNKADKASKSTDKKS